MSRSVTILGSTGSIGCQTLEIVRHHPMRFKICALAAGSNAALLSEQARVYRPKFVGIADRNVYTELKKNLADLPQIEIGAGEEAINHAAELQADVTVAAIVGVAGLNPTMTAIKRGKSVAFASKECLAAAGSMMMNAVKASHATLLPVDSEHNAIFQVLDSKNTANVRRIVLTASGGPFREWPLDKIRQATPEQALAHPTWKMGPKVSIDSATLMNKALEVIEAHHLFGMQSEKIDVLMHPQSVVHGMVEYNDGSLLAQMGPPDMRTPISVCLDWPNRIETPGTRLDLSRLAHLEFNAPDTTRFPALRLVREVLKGGPADAIIFNAANEMAVAAFLARQIGFTDIVDIVARMLGDCHKPAIKSLDDVIACDQDVRARFTSMTKKAA